MNVVCFLELQQCGFSTGNSVVILKARLCLPPAFSCGLWYEIKGSVVVHSRAHRWAQVGCDLLVEGCASRSAPEGDSIRDSDGVGKAVC